MESPMNSRRRVTWGGLSKVPPPKSKPRISDSPLGCFSTPIELDRVLARGEPLRELVRADHRRELWPDRAVDDHRVFLPAPEVDGDRRPIEANDRARSRPSEPSGAAAGIDTPDIVHRRHART